MNVEPLLQVKDNGEEVLELEDQHVELGLDALNDQQLPARLIGAYALPGLNEVASRSSLAVVERRDCDGELFGPVEEIDVEGALPADKGQQVDQPL